ncbi:MAG: 1-deoxy-D-xylulose-5-phosphate synthase, partial [Clostridia bacterium]|nr:1-deoxy-D-xylulose-5-phosphate synthase [Clostridia bacterium]
KKLNIKQLPELCNEIRENLLKTVLNNGGHLASNLGVVELTVALHYVFDDTDKIVWDVGHQAYIHKLLTGRGGKFSSLRQKDGLSGFPTKEESSQDVFGVGHASTAISASLGIAKARDIQNQNFDVIAVVGDGALTGGLSYEGLNSIGDTKMFIILNDNNMAIDKNVGSATKNLSKVRISKRYLRLKKRTKAFLAKLPLLGKPLLRLGKKIVRNIRLKKLHNIYFENFNIRYVGPVNGHDVKELVFYLTEIKNNIDKPTVLHVLTKKGKGYSPAELNPNKYHGVSQNNAVSKSNMSNILGLTLTEMAVDNPKISVITAAMADGTGTTCFRDAHPDRFFDVGIAEQHAVTFAGGLASQGLKPYVVIYSTFLQRSYDQILHDVCIQNLPVTFCIDRAGFVGQDGQTHQGLFDMAYLLPMPNIKILTPSSTTQLKQMLTWSENEFCPIAIRYPKNSNQVAEDISTSFNVNQWGYIGATSPSCVIFAVGPNALSASYQAMKNLSNSQIAVGVVDVTTIKPIDKSTINKLINAKLFLTIEEGMITGGFSSAIKDYLLSLETKIPKILSIGVNDIFVKHATINQQLEEHNISPKKICDLILKNSN